MRRSSAVLLSVTLASCALSAGGAPAVAVSSFDHSQYGRILRSVVIGESVDYARLRAEHLESLDTYLDRMAAVDPAEMSEDDRLAFYINLYNATVLSAVAHRYEPDYSPSDDDFRLFDEPLVRVSGKRATLNDLEHRLMRRQFDEPRIHVALVCAARSCPPLIDRAYEGHSLEEELERRMQAFLDDPSRNTVDTTTGRLELSQIFEWYAEDFGGHEGLPAYVDRYTEPDVVGLEVSFRPYSWELNDVER